MTIIPGEIHPNYSSSKTVEEAGPIDGFAMSSYIEKKCAEEDIPQAIDILLASFEKNKRNTVMRAMAEMPMCSGLLTAYTKFNNPEHQKLAIEKIQTLFQERLNTITENEKEPQDKQLSNGSKVVLLMGAAELYWRTTKFQKAQIPEIDQLSLSYMEQAKTRYPEEFAKALSKNLTLTNLYQNSLCEEMKNARPDLADSINTLIAQFTVNGNINWEELEKSADYQKIVDVYKTPAPEPQPEQQPFVINEGEADKGEEKVNLPTPNVDDSFKEPLRTFFSKVAKDEGSEYIEDEKAAHFEAQIKKPDGSFTKFEATGAKDISISAADAEGKPKTPDMKYFKDTVDYIRSQNSFVTFGNIKNPEFKARLLLACLQSDPLMKIQDQPKLDKAFLSSIEPETAEKLKAFLKEKGKEKEEKNPKEVEPEAEAGTEISPYDKSMKGRIKSLKEKEQNGSISAQEKAEVKFYFSQFKAEKELKIAKEKFKSDAPRDAEWQQLSGLPLESYKSFNNSRPGDESWKIHLDVCPNHDEETTKAISEYLEQLGVNHKVYAGGENGKGMTVYTGSYLDTTKLCYELRDRFGDKVKLPPAYCDQVRQEVSLANVATARFMVPKVENEKGESKPIFDSTYPGAIKGISPARINEIDSDAFLITIAKQAGILNKEVVAPRTQNADNAPNLYAVDVLEAYVSHQLYAKKLGEFYYGKDKDKFEGKMFGDALPPAGSDERQKWDDMADKYETFLKAKAPKKMTTLENLSKNYKRIDFRKVPPTPEQQAARDAAKKRQRA